MEFSTLDRVLYNLMSNATRYAADGQVDLHLLAVPPASLRDVRFVVTNQSEANHLAQLNQAFPDGLSGLFRGGFTTGGHGLGLTICADIVGNAYGVPGRGECIEQRYVGASARDSLLAFWFHWPALSEPETKPEPQDRSA